MIWTLVSTKLITTLMASIHDTRALWRIRYLVEGPKSTSRTCWMLGEVTQWEQNPKKYREAVFGVKPFLIIWYKSLVAYIWNGVPWLLKGSVARYPKKTLSPANTESVLQLLTRLSFFWNCQKPLSFSFFKKLNFLLFFIFWSSQTHSRWTLLCSHW